MSEPSAAPPPELGTLLQQLRPRLHRYCARMTGSVIDGEDVVQEALLKAVEAAPAAGSIVSWEGWMFRIAHHAALDFLRRRSREEAHHASEDPEMIEAAVHPVENREAAAASLMTFMRLPASQRSAVILCDVLGHSLQEAADGQATTVTAVKAALQRGRARLRALASEADVLPPPVLAEAARARLMSYVERFNAHDFDSLREMLTEDVHLELVNLRSLEGKKSVAPYFSNYAIRPHWRFSAGFVDRRPAVLVHDGDDPERRVRFFILLSWMDGHVTGIRDFVFARYAMEGARIEALD